jgi:spore coat protein CotF
MNEKDMVNDYLTMIKSSLTTYANVISETNNQELRATFQQLRNQDEQRQYQIYQTAVQKQYYKPAAFAQSADIQQIKADLTGQSM